MHDVLFLKLSLDFSLHRLWLIGKLLKSTENSVFPFNKCIKTKNVYIPLSFKHTNKHHL